MRILFAASEAAPFAKTGGLADVAGSLPRALAELGHDVRLVMPRYRRISPEAYALKHRATFSVPLGSWKERCDVLEGRLGRDVPVYFVNKDVYFDRPELYCTAKADYPDNAERFIFFSRAVLELCGPVGFEPEIIHCNDWQTALVPFYLKKVYQDAEPLRHTRTALTVHNLGYQGLFWHWDMRLLGAGWEEFNPESLEFWGKLNFLKAGLVHADAITTVSTTYSREIQTPEYGHGLEGVLRKRAPELYGIVNGIDYDEWNPAADGMIAKTFSVAEPSGKAACKTALQARLGLPGDGSPLIGMVTRLTEQKGLDILAEILPEILSLGVQLVVLGTGEETYHRILTDAADLYERQMRVLLQYDDALAHAIYGGCDLFLMPSRYEPCGLGQMIALRYGAVPVVRRTGGLADTVVDYDRRTGRGTGFAFKEYTGEALLEAVRRAVETYGEGTEWRRLLRAGMKQDFSWERSAREYVKVYQKTKEKRQRKSGHR